MNVSQMMSKTVSLGDIIRAARIHDDLRWQT